MAKLHAQEVADKLRKEEMYRQALEVWKQKKDALAKQYEVGAPPFFLTESPAASADFVPLTHTHTYTHMLSLVRSDSLLSIPPS